MTATQGPQPTPDQILQVGFGFWASKTLLSAIELEVFTELGKIPYPYRICRADWVSIPDQLAIFLTR